MYSFFFLVFSNTFSSKVLIKHKHNTGECYKICERGFFCKVNCFVFLETGQLKQKRTVHGSWINFISRSSSPKSIHISISQFGQMNKVQFGVALDYERIRKSYGEVTINFSVYSVLRNIFIIFKRNQSPRSTLKLWVEDNFIVN